MDGATQALAWSFTDTLGVPATKVRLRKWHQGREETA